MIAPASRRWPEFDGKVAVITGGSQGIGRGIVAAFAENGAKIVIAGRNREAAERVAAAASAEFGVETMAATTDVAKSADCAGLMQATAQRFGAADILVNNAAYFSLIPLLDASLDDADRMLGTNLRGPLLLGQAFARWNIENRRPGVIVNISSIAGARPAPGCGLYSASKAALNSLTKSMALEWTPLGVRVNGVAPGHVETEGVRGDFESGRLDYDAMTGAIPARRIADVADIANAVLFLSSEQSRHIVGATLTIDGGEAL